MAAAIGGTITLAIDGKRYRAKGEFTYNLGGYNRTTIMGHTGPEGFKVEAREPFLEGSLTDSKDFSIVQDLYSVEDASILLELANGKTITFKNAWYSGNGDVKTMEGEINLKFTAISAQEIKS